MGYEKCKKKMSHEGGLAGRAMKGGAGRVGHEGGRRRMDHDGGV